MCMNGVYVSMHVDMQVIWTKKGASIDTIR